MLSGGWLTLWLTVLSGLLLEERGEHHTGFQGGSGGAGGECRHGQRVFAGGDNAAGYHQDPAAGVGW